MLLGRGYACAASEHGGEVLRSFFTEAEIMPPWCMRKRGSAARSCTCSRVLLCAIPLTRASYLGRAVRPRRRDALFTETQGCETFSFLAEVVLCELDETMVRKRRGGRAVTECWLSRQVAPASINA